VSIAALARMVRLSHSLFALPFAVAAVVLVSREARLDPLRLGLVALCVVAARTAAMA
jgi:4-hydroxybenzoate polyprenyltransferase